MIQANGTWARIGTRSAIRKASFRLAPTARIASNDCDRRASPSVDPAPLRTQPPSTPAGPLLSRVANFQEDNWPDHVQTDSRHARTRPERRSSGRLEKPGPLPLTH